MKRIFKTKGFYAGVFSAILLSVAIFYGYKEIRLSSIPKDYSYYEKTMASDENIIGMNSDIQKIQLLIRHRVITKLKAPEAKYAFKNYQKSAEFKNHKKEFKDRKDFYRYYVNLGFDHSKERSEVALIIKNQTNRMKIFVRQNPEFSKLNHMQQQSLLVNAFKKIRLADIPLFQPAQEHTRAECEENYANAEAAAAAAYDNDYAYYNGYWYQNCMASNPVGNYCDNELSNAIFAITQNYNNTMSDALSEFNSCMSDCSDCW